MNGQRDIFGQEEARVTPAPPGRHETVPLFHAPTTMRGQLSAWAESVCDAVEREPNRLDDWARQAVGDV
jgi:hypothetical protein